MRKKMRLIKYLIFLVFLHIRLQCLENEITQFSNSLGIKKVVLWGYKLHTHTHSYIHWGFYRAFKHLGFETYWFDNNDDVKNFDFTGSLFITEGQIDQRIPKREDCFYILHNCDYRKYKELLEKNRCITLQVYTNSIFTRKVVKIDNCMYYSINDPNFGNIIYLPWATDLFPHEIDEIKNGICNIKKENVVNWVGTIWDGLFGNRNQLEPFIKACKENGIEWKHTVLSASTQENALLIQRSFMAPAIVGQWQRDEGYIPCRIFKNISYGQMGITNSKTVYELFNKKIIYNEDTYQLFYDAKKRIESLRQEDTFELMDFVRDKHTYLSRIKMILEFMVLCQKQKNS